jgi:hypothetical protein
MKEKISLSSKMEAFKVTWEIYRDNHPEMKFFDKIKNTYKLANTLIREVERDLNRKKKKELEMNLTTKYLQEEGYNIENVTFINSYKKSA